VAQYSVMAAILLSASSKKRVAWEVPIHLDDKAGKRHASSFHCMRFSRPHATAAGMGTFPEPGRVAIDRALDALYPTLLDHRMGLQPAPGEEWPPLEEVVAYRCLTPEPHWHYVSYGLSELREKVSENAERSGFGIELTLRLADASETLPVWPIHYLRWLAKLVWGDGNPYGEGHSLPLPRGILDDVSPGVEGAGFVLDSRLGRVATSTGAVKFLQVLPLTGDEYTLMGRWDAVQVFAELRHQDSELLWRVGRGSILAGPRREQILAAAARDGSSQEVDFTSALTWDTRVIALDALNRHIVLKFLRYRLKYGRPARVHSEEKTLHIEPGPARLELSRAEARLTVPPERAEQLARELEQAGSGTTVSLDGREVFRLLDLVPLDVPGA